MISINRITLSTVLQWTTVVYICLLYYVQVTGSLKLQFLCKECTNVTCYFRNKCIPVFIPVFITYECNRTL